MSTLTSIKFPFLLTFILTTLLLPHEVLPKSQYVQPMMMGLQVAIPYDIANIWNRPVSLSPFISTFLGLSLLYILFFGVITSPFGYMFGVPSQKYVLGTPSTSSLFSAVMDVAEQWHNYKPPPPTTTTPPPSPQYQYETEGEEEDDDDTSEVEEDNSSDSNSPNYSYSTYDPYEDIPRSFSSFKKSSSSHPVTSLLRKLLQFPFPSLNLTSTYFRFIPDAIIPDPEDLEDATTSISCQQLILCMAHSSIPSLSPVTLKSLQIFTKILQNVDSSHEKAIKLGLSSKGNPFICDKHFPECPSNGLSLLLRIFLEGLPSFLRNSLILPQM